MTIVYHQIWKLLQVGLGSLRSLVPFYSSVMCSSISVVSTLAIAEIQAHVKSHSTVWNEHPLCPITCYDNTLA